MATISPGRAIEAGAAAVVLTREPDRALVRSADDHEAAIFVAEDPTEFLLRLAQGYRARMRCTVVGVTGSIGKTTTKDILAAVLAKRFRVHATQGNYNSLIGMPLTILAAPKDTQIMVLEMGMNAPGEIARLTRCAQPTYAVITKIGTSHVGLLGGRENIARAKAEIIQGMPPSSQNFEGHHSALVLSGEDDFTPFIIENFAKPAGVEVVLAGMSADDDVSARAIELDDAGCASFDIMLENGSQYRTGLSIPGLPAVQNALFAAAVARRLGVPQFEIDQAFHELAITGRRQQVRACASGARVIDDSLQRQPRVHGCRPRPPGGSAGRERAQRRAGARWARWAMRPRACTSWWAPTRPPSTSTFWCAWAARTPAASRMRRASWACPPIASSTWRAPSAPARGGEAPSGPATWCW